MQTGFITLKDTHALRLSTVKPRLRSRGDFPIFLLVLSRMQERLTTAWLWGCPHTHTPSTPEYKLLRDKKIISSLEILGLWALTWENGQLDVVRLLHHYFSPLPNPGRVPILLKPSVLSCLYKIVGFGITLGRFVWFHNSTCCQLCDFGKSLNLSEPGFICWEIRIITLTCGCFLGWNRQYVYNLVSPVPRSKALSKQLNKNSLCVSAHVLGLQPSVIS